MFGSFAKSTQHEWSDIDVALVQMSLPDGLMSIICFRESELENLTFALKQKSIQPIISRPAIRSLMKSNKLASRFCKNNNSIKNQVNN